MYQVLFKNNPIFEIEMGKKGRGTVHIFDYDRLPFDIYLEESDDIDDRYNNKTNFEIWCAERVLTLDRIYSKAILNELGFPQASTDAERAQIGIATRCLSLNDCYWLKDVDEEITWEQVNLFDNSLENSVFEVALFGKSPTVTNTELVYPDITTDGTAPKAWLRSGNDFYLMKGDRNDSVVKETEASEVLQQLGFNSVNYEFTLFKGEPVSKCKCFTSKDINFNRAFYFSIWCMNHEQSILDYITKYQRDFDMMVLSDYIIGNADNHGKNWGFLYDGDLNILSLSPLMDFDHAFEAGDFAQSLPSAFLGVPQTQIKIASAALKKYPDIQERLRQLDLDGLKYGSFVKHRVDNLFENLQLEQRSQRVNISDVKETDDLDMFDQIDDKIIDVSPEHKAVLEKMKSKQPIKRSSAFSINESKHRPKM